MLAARQHATRAGLRFEAIDKPLRLASLVSASDELVVLADGILPDRVALTSSLADQHGVVAFPADIALPLGFERLDPTRAWSGALRTSGSVINPLLDLPPDCDVASSLLRIALQRGTPIVEGAEQPLNEGSWLRRVTPQSAAASEWNWITRQVQPTPFIAPLLAVSERIGLRLAQDAVNGRWARVPHIACAVGLFGSVVALVLGWPTVGLGLLLLASILLAIAGVFDRVSDLGTVRQTANSLLPAMAAVRDIALVFLAAAIADTEPPWFALFLPIALVALLYLGEVSAAGRLQPLFRDRPIVIGILLVAAIFDLGLTAQALIISAALACLLIPAIRATRQITAD